MNLEHSSDHDSSSIKFKYVKNQSGQRQAFRIRCAMLVRWAAQILSGWELSNKAKQSVLKSKVFREHILSNHSYAICKI